jgi:hypothetical protein
MFKDLREFNHSLSHWTVRAPDYSKDQMERASEPDARTAHSLVAYWDKVVLFGGAGEFI